MSSSRIFFSSRNIYALNQFLFYGGSAKVEWKKKATVIKNFIEYSVLKWEKLTQNLIDTPEMSVYINYLSNNVNIFDRKICTWAGKQLKYGNYNE